MDPCSKNIRKMQVFRLAIFTTFVLCISGTTLPKSENEKGSTVETLNTTLMSETMTPIFSTGRVNETEKNSSRGFNDTTHYSEVTPDPDLSSSIDYEYCKFGGHMEYLSIHCPSEKLSKLKNAIGDIDQLPHTQVIAIVISSIAVGCSHTAQFLTTQLLELNNSEGFCNETVSNAPSEIPSTPCDLELAENIRESFKINETFKIMYEALAPPLYLTLGCHKLGRKYFNFLKDDLNNTKITESIINLHDNTEELYANKSKFEKGTLIMHYFKNHEFDSQKIQSIDEVEDDLPVDFNNTLQNSRRKRSATGQDIETYFKRKEKCSIVLPLGVTVQTPSKTECLQLCLDEDSCQSVGYTHDESQICQLNTETEKEAGAMFKCMSGESIYWEYFEKKKDVNYFIITWKKDGRVLQATSERSVNIHSFHGDDSQFWFWDGDAIRSKKYTTKVLDLNYKNDHVYLHSYHGGSNQRWNYDNEGITSQYNSFKLSVKKYFYPAYIGVSKETSEKWSLSLDRFYFIVTNKRSGKVLDVNGDCTIGKVIMWSYHGGDNQLWFWDDENIRSKKCPEKVLDLHMYDYNLFNWGKVYLHPFNGGDNQKWIIEKDNIISRFKNLRLDVKNENKADGAIVGGNSGNSKTNQKWTLGTLRTYFFILNKKSGKVIDASSPSRIEQRHYYKGDNQLWFWDDDVIRNKKYSDKVIDLHMADYTRTGWGKLYLHDFHGGLNQRWMYTDQYLISMYQNLSAEVSKESLSDNSMIGGQKGKTQKWSLNPESDFFTITSRQNAKVLDAYNERGVHMWSYHGKDHQLWFWDEHFIRSKKYPYKVLDLHWHDYERKNWGKVYLHPFNGGDNQKWQLDGDSIISNYKQLHLDIRYSNTGNGAKVGCFRNSRKLNQMWSLNPKERVYFIVKGQQSGRVLDVQSNFKIIIWSYNGGDHQLFFWDKDSIRSKKYPDKVVDLHVADYKRNNWGNIYMHPYHGGENQKWSIDGDYIVSNFQGLVIDVFHRRTHNGAIVGGKRKEMTNNQKWELAASHGRKSGNQGSCIDKTEEDIYNVVQWLPLISTVWDLFSSIGYAAAGCTSVANERAISFAIGTVMDVATIATGGAASAATSVIKTGVKAGIKFGLKQGMKSAVRFTKQSIQNVVRKTITKIGSSGLLSTLKSGVKKAGKLIVRETIIDPAKFLKNTGKLSKSILTHPKRTLKQIWKAASDSIENLKQLKSKYRSLKNGKTPSFDEFDTIGKTRCKRGLLSCVRSNVEKGYSETQERMYHELLKEGTNKLKYEKSVDLSAQRYMKIKANSYDKDFIGASMVKRKIDGLTGLDKAESFAVYSYTVKPNINYYVQPILEKKPLLQEKFKLLSLADEFPSKSKEELNDLWKSKKTEMLNDENRLANVDEHLYQATLMQSYLKKNPLKSPTTVTRYEDIKFTGHLYENNKVYTSDRFISTTKRTERYGDFKNRQKYNTVLTINLKKSGSDVSSISRFPGQEEVVIPLNTKFSVRRSDPDEKGIIKIVLTELD